MAFLGAEIRNGAEEVLKLLEAEKMVKKADLVLTGEGKLDSQTRYGKAPAALARLCRKHGKPLLFVCAINELSPRAAKRLGLHRLFSFEELNVSSSDSKTRAHKWAAMAASRVLKSYLEERNAENPV